MNLRQLSGAPLALAIILLAGCGNEVSKLPRDEQTVGGITIDLGVMPAALVQGHSMGPGAPGAASGAAQNPAAHHIVVALFDATTGGRITDARIRAGVGDRSYNHEPDQWLAEMPVNGMMTYGGYFPMGQEGLWRIHLEIYRPGVANPIEANFAYEHPGGF